MKVPWNESRWMTVNKNGVLRKHILIVNTLTHVFEALIRYYRL